MQDGSAEFKINISLKDYRAFNIWHLFLSSNPIIIFIASLLILICLPVLLFLFLKDGNLFSLIVFVMGCLSLLFILIILPLTIIVTSKSVYKSDRFLQEEQNFKVDENQLTIDTESSSFKLNWKEIYKGVENKNYFLIYIAKIKAIIIPKVQISDEDREFLKQKIEEWKKE